MNNSAKCCYIILCLIFVIIILLTLTKDIIMDNNEKKIQEDFGGKNAGMSGGRGAGGFSGGRGGNFGGRMGANMGMRGANFSQGNVGMRRAGSALGGAHVYNRNYGWRNHSSNFYRPFFYAAPMWYWNNGSYNNGGYYDNYPNTVNYNFYDVREGDEN
jgi:hypothetical protein